jgi:hypothetical protein
MLPQLIGSDGVRAREAHLARLADGAIAKLQPFRRGSRHVHLDAVDRIAIIVWMKL